MIRRKAVMTKVRRPLTFVARLSAGHDTRPVWSTYASTAGGPQTTGNLRLLGYGLHTAAAVVIRAAGAAPAPG